MPEFQYRVPSDEAMSWELHKESLNWALTDAAEKAARTKYGRAFDDLEVHTRITSEAGEFVITFTWREGDLPATRRVRVSFDVITRRSGTTLLDVPTGTNVEALLDDHLNKHGNDLARGGLPAGVTVHEWNMQEPGDHTIEADWVEDATPTEENA